ncbi:hypothetical protein [Rugosimonospora africana]|uniref:Uncharacterized protein n=1 Tax=Rugosimonospora africana TaxID=556532 RepID=A0A8J3QRQ0_9ACTN|nr:hypothetical protein [Rugosimonospora africana]GIH15663.1 hypothetical protein Raf01_38350 [Rugosimonospora africana]
MNPDDSPLLRQARLLLLLSVTAETAPDGVDAERLGICDFLAVHPLLLARLDGDPDRLSLRLAGFDDRAVGYASPAQRFVTAQLRLAGDLAELVGRGLVSVHPAGRIRYRLTPRGEDMADTFTAMYSQSYLAAARVVIRRTRRLSGRKLRAGLRQWLMVDADAPLHPAFPLVDEHVPDPLTDRHPVVPHPPKDLT